MRTFEINLSAGQLRVAVVAARFNQEVVRNLVDGCLERLSKLGCGEVDLLWVPGAFELPLAARTALETGRYDAAVVLGAVIRGETSHFDYVCRAATDGVIQLQAALGLPVAFGVITTDTAEQARARAAAPGSSGPNKGAEAAEVAVEMANLLSALRGGN